jgi:tRNA (mo5U34)-methyltransferase
VADRVTANPLWYHCIDLGGGLVTNGWFDLRPIVDHLPWPDVAGKRCLDVGTYDGFLAFELERRGASEVVATDIPNHADWDWLPRDRAKGVAYLESVAGQKGEGFELAAEALGSRVHREFINVYDLSPERLGSFDLVVCGSLLLHLRDPYRALEAIRGVCGDRFMSCEQIDVVLTALHPWRPCLGAVGDQGQWLVPNVAGHRHMLHTAGFDVLRTVSPYSVPTGPAHPTRRSAPRVRARQAVQQVVTKGLGVPMSAALTKPI